MEVSVVYKYNVFVRFLHWLTFFMLVFMLSSGFVSAHFGDFVPEIVKPYLMLTHKRIGVAILVITFVRVLIRIYSSDPADLDYVKKWENIVAKLVHIILYILLFSMAGSGYIMSEASGRTINWFFDINLPHFIQESKVLSGVMYNIHYYSAFLITSFIILHIGAVFYHLFVHRSNIFRRIV